MLQGSLENFALDEVLGLLSGTSKTGQLEIAGNRGTGSLTFSEGRLADGAASHTANGTEIEDVMFELLRYDDGTFTFTSVEVDIPDHPENVASVLAAAENRLRDWRSIEAVVPTLAHQVTPAPDLPADEVTVTRGEWAALTVIAAGCPVSLVCDKLELGEVEGSRQIKNLAERQLVNVSDPLGSFSTVSRLTSGSGTTTGLDPNSGFGAVASAMPSPSADATEESEASSSTDDRPPMPPAPAPEDMAEPTSAATGGEDTVPAGSVPSEPPSPAEISEFSDGVEDASELMEGASDANSSLLMRYLKSED